MKALTATAIIGTLLVTCAANAGFAELHGLTVKDGKLYKDAGSYRGIGVNYCDLFQDMIHHPEEQRTLKGDPVRALLVLRILAQRLGFVFQ